MGGKYSYWTRCGLVTIFFLSPREDPIHTASETVFSLVTRGRFIDVGVKIDIEPNGGTFDASPEK